MATNVSGINEQKLFKIGRLNLRSKYKEWFKKLAMMPVDWQAIKVVMF
jgi:hypothetical protein